MHPLRGYLSCSSKVWHHVPISSGHQNTKLLSVLGWKHGWGRSKKCMWNICHGDKKPSQFLVRFSLACVLSGPSWGCQTRQFFQVLSNAVNVVYSPVFIWVISHNEFRVKYGSGSRKLSNTASENLQWSMMSGMNKQHTHRLLYISENCKMSTKRRKALWGTLSVLNRRFISRTKENKRRRAKP